MKPSSVGGDAGRVEAEVGCGRAATGRQENGVRLDGSGSLTTADRHRCGGVVDAIAMIADRCHLCAENQLDALLLQQCLDDVGHVTVLAAQERLVAVDDADGGTEAREHAGELEPHVAAAHDDQAPWQGIDVLEGGGVVDPCAVIRAVDAGPRRH
jgi:hypothetical protein